MFFNLKKFTFLSVLLLFFNTAKVIAEPHVTHVVVCWLKNDVTKSEIQNIIAQSKTFADIDGVLSLDIGEPIYNDRKAVDSSYSFALSIKFDSQESMELYVLDKRHQAFLNNMLKPKLSKIIIYDFAETR